MDEIVSMITGFSGVFNAIMTFLTGNPYTFVIIAGVLVLGIAAGVFALIRS